uniref:Uncharacterized protein n=1 Tax=Arundo donax TaxID=35708 RepID=A0A0A9BXX4_ARUDO
MFLSLDGIHWTKRTIRRACLGEGMLRARLG